MVTANRKLVNGWREIAIATPAADGVQIQTTNGWWRKEMFDDYAMTQELPQPRGEAVVLTDAGAIHQGSMGAVGATRTLQPGETWRQRFSDLVFPQSTL